MEDVGYVGTSLLSRVSAIISNKALIQSYRAKPFFLQKIPVVMTIVTNRTLLMII